MIKSVKLSFGDVVFLTIWFYFLLSGVMDVAKAVREQTQYMQQLEFRELQMERHLERTQLEGEKVV